MIKSKIPLPSKRPAQSSIPVPTKTSGTQVKKTIVPKKPVLIEPGQFKPSNIGEKNEKNVKRFPFKPQDSKKVTQTTAKPSSKFRDAGRVCNFINKPIRENKVLRQKKTTSRQLSKNIDCQSNAAAGKENQPRRYTSFKSGNDKKVEISNKSKRANKPALQPKIITKPNISKEISNIISKEKVNNDQLVSEKAENVAMVAPTKQSNLMIKSGVDDSDFKNSCFFKSLILNEKELSPGIMKMCASEKFSPHGVFLDQHQKKSVAFLAGKELVEEVRRISSNYYRSNGRLVMHSPGTLRIKAMSGKDIVDEVRRLSEFRSQRLQNHQSLMDNRRWTCNVPNKPSIAHMTTAEIATKIKELPEIRRESGAQSILKENRRWTCNVPDNKSIANMSTTEIAAKLKELSEIRRESGAQSVKKAAFFNLQNSVERLNPHQKVLREIEVLTTKKKSKKKVAFLIPDSGSPKYQPFSTSITEKPESKLSDIPEVSSQNCTPEMVLDNKAATNPKSCDNEKKDEDTSVTTTPELILPPYKFSFDFSAKGINATQPFDTPQKDNESTANSSLDRRTAVTSGDDKDSCKDNFDLCFQKSNVNLFTFRTDLLPSKFSSQIENDYAFNLRALSDIDLAATDTTSEFINSKPTECLFQPAIRITPPVNETGHFCVNTEKKIYTPHPISKSNLPPSVSPLFLPGKLNTLDSCAPICTPYVLKNLARSPEVRLSDVRQKLDFNEKPNLTLERRESQLIIQTIPTFQKMNDFLCDQECLMLSSQSTKEDLFLRNLCNPIATTLTYGDGMHFIPLSSP